MKLKPILLLATLLAACTPDEEPKCMPSGEIRCNYKPATFPNEECRTECFDSCGNLVQNPDCPLIVTD